MQEKEEEGLTKGSEAHVREARGQELLGEPLTRFGGAFIGDGQGAESRMRPRPPLERG